MDFISTRDQNIKASFKEALFKGLSPDGGLYHPTQIPDMTEYFKTLKQGTPFNEIAEYISLRVLEPEINTTNAASIVDHAFNFQPELRKVNENISILELFHGPSCAFKDFGASFMASAMEEFLVRDNKRTIILVATSGDTGSAVARAFHKKKNLDVVILYPSGRVSQLQEKQLTTLGDNVTALEVDGAFDDCQRMVKEAFMDKTLNSRLILTSANSINLGRLIPQSFYYVYAYGLLNEEQRKNYYFCVPSGNFGNLTAGLYAWTWGLPLNGFIAATNVNDVVPEYLKTTVFSPRASKKTLSNAMDVGNPSNFERMEAIFHKDHYKMNSLIHGEVVTDKETEETIKEVYNEYGLQLCPHTAVGYLSAKRFLAAIKGTKPHIVVLSTAHAGKFLETVEEVTGKRPELPASLLKCLELPKESIKIGTTLEELSGFLLKKFA